MPLAALLRIDAEGVMRPRRRAATFVELSAALRQYLLIVARMHRQRALPPGFRYGSSEELILFNAKPVWANLDEMTLPPMPPKECFDNAVKAAAVFPAYRYTEGFALMDGSIPTHHGWLTGPAGEAVDPTWPAVHARHAEREPGKRWSGRVVYMGISIGPDEHLRWMEKTGFPNFLAVHDDDVEELLKHGLNALAAGADSPRTPPRPNPPRV